MTLMTKEQAEAKRAEIKMEIQKSDVRMQEMQCAIAKHRRSIAEIEVSVDGQPAELMGRAERIQVLVGGPKHTITIEVVSGEEKKVEAGSGEAQKLGVGSGEAHEVEKVEAGSGEEEAEQKISAANF